MTKIDDNIPLPPNPCAPQSQFQVVINELKIGQSFFIATAKVESTRVLVLKCATRAGVTITTRKWEQEGETGLRVWRVE